MADTEIVGVAASRGHPSSGPCSVEGCDGPDRVTCDYRDRRGAPCATAWCPEHIITVGSWHFCRRHAPLARALVPAEFRGELPAPDLDNRAPSLAEYLGDALDTPMRRLLEELCRPASGERVTAEGLDLVNSPTRGRRWARGWKLFDSSGPLLRISVEVDEERDPECAVRLNGRIVLRSVPPWIERRGAGDPPPAAEEAARRRQAFFDTLMEQHIRPAVIAEERWARRWNRSPGATIRG